MGQAVYVARRGGPEVLELREQTLAAPGRGEARVRIDAAGVNFIDTYQRSGAYPRPLPFILGSEGAGVIESVGADTGALQPGTRVAWAQVPGSYAHEVNAHASVLVPIQDGVSSEQAAAAMLQGMTAHYLAHGVRQTKTGDVALVHAAAGGTGRLLVQLLKRAGARVIGTCSTEQKERSARAAGADEVIRYNDTDFAVAARTLTAGVGVDVVYDSVGLTTFDKSLLALRPRGLMVLFGQSSGAVPPFDLQRLNQAGGLFLTRPSMGQYVATRAELEQRAGEVLRAVADGSLELSIDRVLPLEQAAEAHRVLESRAATGKLLLTPTR